MVEHRPARHLAKPALAPGTRSAPVPGRDPAQLAAEAQTAASRPRRVRRKPTPLPRRLARRMKRSLRGPRGKWVLIALACVAVLLVGLLAEGFLSSPAPALKAPPALADGTGTAGAGGAGLGASHSPSASPSRSGAAGDPVQQTLRNALPDNPLNHLKGAKIHTVTVEANSSEPIPLVGYLVPTGLNTPYDTVKPNAPHWSVTQRAVGGGYLAAIFIQAGRSGAPVTCTVSVDGKVTNRETTSGAYGRSVCLG